jgi:LPXTG-motif cell wall-anchored protein
MRAIGVAGGMRPPLAPPSKGGEIGRVALGCALVSLAFFSGCSGVQSKNDAAAKSGNAVERSAQKGPVRLTVRVWPREPRLSDLVEMDVTVLAQADVEIKPPAFGQGVGDFLIRDYSERPAEAGVKNLRRFHYQLEPAHAGKHLIRSVSIEFLDKRPGSEQRGEPALVETEPLEINVTSEFGGAAPSLANLEPMTAPQPVPQTFAALWLAAAGLAGILAIAAGVVLFRRRKRRPVEIRRRTPEEIAHAALALLLAENLPGRGLVKEFYLRLTGIVRQYVEDTTGIRAPEQTTEEFLRDMRSHQAFPRERSVRLAEFLEAADLIKYAGQQPEEGQIELATARAHEFVNLTPSQTAAMAGALAD